jgi:polyhydroxybutyrate depolymerase
MKIPMRPRRSRHGGPATLPLACAALLLIAAGPALAVYSAGNNIRSLTHDSLLREYNVYVPVGYDGLSPVPLVVDLHGAGSDKGQQQLISGWNVKSDSLRFLVAYPDAIWRFCQRVHTEP